MTLQPDKRVVARFPGAFTITPFRNDCLVEMLWDPFVPPPGEASAPFPPPAIPLEPGRFIIGPLDGRALAVGRIAMMPEPSPDAPKRSAETEAIAAALAAVGDTFKVLGAPPRVKQGDLVLFPPGATTPIPVEGYESTRLLPLSAIVARLDP